MSNPMDETLKNLRAEHSRIQDEQGQLADAGYSADDPHMVSLEKQRVALAKKIAGLKVGGIK